jgi:hypothetical protein
MSERPKSNCLKELQLKLFTVRCTELAQRVARNEIRFIDAVDIAFDAATWSGLIDGVGDDVVQSAMAAAFAHARSRP